MPQIDYNHFFQDVFGTLQQYSKFFGIRSSKYSHDFWKFFKVFYNTFSEVFQNIFKKFSFHFLKFFSKMFRKTIKMHTSDQYFSITDISR